MIKCVHIPTSTHLYGVYKIGGRPRDTPMNKVSLCDTCGKELWDRIKDSVAALHMHYEVSPMNVYYKTKD